MSSVTTLAEDRKGASGWQVSFDGSKITNNFSKSDMDDEIYAMEPGDSVELTISLKNSFNGQADWYMRNQVLETLEKSAEIAGGAYDYLLTYKDASGATTTLYSSEKFGGEGRYNGVGLKGATTTLDEYFYLDRLGKEDTGVVKLKVALDGETLVNSYQSTLAVLQMDFATELVKSGTSTQTPGRNREIIKTGDQSQIMLYILLALGSGLLLLMLAFLRMRREKEEPVWETETDCKKEAEIV